MSSELAPFNAGILGNVTQTDLAPEQFNALVQTSEYIRPLNILQQMSKVFQDPQFNGRAGQIIFDMSAPTRKLLGNTVDIVPIMYRPHAMLIKNDEIVKETFDLNDPIYNEIQGLAATKEKGALPGLDFLVWVPAVKSYAVYFMYKTATRIAPEIKSRMKQPITLGSKLVEYNGNSWYTPTVTPTTAEIELPTDVEELNKVIDLFKNPVTKANSAPVVTGSGRPT